MFAKVKTDIQSFVSISSSRSRYDKKFPEHLFDQLEDEPLDLLDRQKTRSALQSSNTKRKKGLEEEPEIDSDGRLIIREDGELMTKKPAHPESDARSEAGSYLSRNSRKTQKRQKTSESESGWAYTGSEYASKKAGGDVKKKGKLEPYAYWPLDRKLMSRRPQHRAAAKKGMASVVKLTKKLEGKSASGLLSAGSSKFKKSHKKSSNKKKIK